MVQVIFSNAATVNSGLGDIPAICFTDSEIVSAGLSPAEAQAQGYEIRTGQFPFSANGRAMTMVSEEGFVRVAARADTNLVLGLQAVGAGGTIHAHPTRSEAGTEGFGERF